MSKYFSKSQFEENMWYVAQISFPWRYGKQQGLKASHQHAPHKSDKATSTHKVAKKKPKRRTLYGRLDVRPLKEKQVEGFLSKPVYQFGLCCPSSALPQR